MDLDSAINTIAVEQDSISEANAQATRTTEQSDGLQIDPI